MSRPRARWNAEIDVTSEQHTAKRRLILREAGAAFNEHGFRNVSLDEVAQMQNVPEGTVKTRLFHGRKNVKACVEGKLGSAR